MKQINCMIVDDEPIACEIIMRYCSHFSFLQLIAVCENALDAFNLSACDYLLKPFSLERFIVAIDKVADRFSATAPAAVSQTRDPTPDHFFIRSDGKIFKINNADLLYAEAKGNYTKIVTASKVILPPITFSGFEELLDTRLFIRVHRSFIINQSKIDRVEGNLVIVNNVEIPIGRIYREAFLQRLGF